MFVSEVIEQEPGVPQLDSEWLDAAPRVADAQSLFFEPTLEQLAEQYFHHGLVEHLTPPAQPSSTLGQDPTVATHYLATLDGEPQLYPLGTATEHTQVLQTLHQFGVAQVEPPGSILDSLSPYPSQSALVHTLVAEGTGLWETETGLEFFFRDSEFHQRVYQIQLPQISLPLDEVEIVTDPATASERSNLEIATSPPKAGPRDDDSGYIESNDDPKIRETEQELTPQIYQLQLVKREDGELDIVDAQGKPWHFDTEAQKQQVIDGLQSSLRQVLIETEEPRSRREYTLQGDAATLELGGSIPIQLQAAFEEVEVPVVQLEETSSDSTSDSSESAIDTGLSADSDLPIATPTPPVSKPETTPSWWQQFAAPPQEVHPSDLGTVVVPAVETQSDELGGPLHTERVLEDVKAWPANHRPEHEVRIKAEPQPQTPAPNIFVRPVPAESREPEGDVINIFRSTQNQADPVRLIVGNTPGVLPAGRQGTGLHTPGVKEIVRMSPVAAVPDATREETVIFSSGSDSPLFSQVTAAVDSPLSPLEQDLRISTEIPLNPPLPKGGGTGVPLFDKEGLGEICVSPVKDSAEHVFESPSPPSALKYVPPKLDDEVIPSLEVEVEERPMEDPESAPIQQAQSNSNPHPVAVIEPESQRQNSGDPKTPMEPLMVSLQTEIRGVVESVTEVTEFAKTEQQVEVVQARTEVATEQVSTTIAAERSTVHTVKAQEGRTVERDQRMERTIRGTRTIGNTPGVWGRFTPGVKARARPSKTVRRAGLQSSHVRIESTSGRIIAQRLSRRQRVGRSVLRAADPFGQRDTARDIIEDILDRRQQRAQLTRQPRVPEPTYLADGQISPTRIRPLTRVVSELLPAQITVHSQSVEFAPVSLDLDSRLAFSKRLSHLAQGADLAQPTYHFSLV